MRARIERHASRSTTVDSDGTTRGKLSLTWKDFLFNQAILRSIHSACKGNVRSYQFVTPASGNGYQRLRPCFRFASLLESDSSGGMKNWIKFPLMMAIMSLSFPLTTRAEWTVPLAGNTFRTEPSPGGRGIRRSGEVSWSDPNEVYSTYVYLDRPAVLSISLLGRNPSGKATLTLSAGKTRLPIVIERSESSLLPIGNVEVDQSGYLQLDFQGDYREGEHFGFFKP